MAALGWLATHQNADGSWSAAKPDFDVGVTALAVLAYARASRATDDAARRGLRWLAAQQDAEGCVGRRWEAKYMYGHLIAAAALAEALPHSPSIRNAAQRALDFTLAAQNPGKGWRYSYQSGDNDSSVTGWAVLSLRSAELSGLHVPACANDGAIAWFDSATDQSCKSCFSSHDTCTAIAIYARWKLRHDDPRKAVGFPSVTKDPPSWTDNDVDFVYWFWGTLAVGCNADWVNRARAEILKHQQSDGSWPPVDRWSGDGGRVYATAINALTLLVPARIR